MMFFSDWVFIINWIWWKGQSRISCCFACGFGKDNSYWFRHKWHAWHPSHAKRSDEQWNSYWNLKNAKDIHGIEWSKPISVNEIKARNAFRTVSNRFIWRNLTERRRKISKRKAKMVNIPINSKHFFWVYTTNSSLSDFSWIYFWLSDSSSTTKYDATNKHQVRCNRSRSICDSFSSKLLKKRTSYFSIFSSFLILFGRDYALEQRAEENVILSIIYIGCDTNVAAFVFYERIKK